MQLRQAIHRQLDCHDLAWTRSRSTNNRRRMSKSCRAMVPYFSQPPPPASREVDVAVVGAGPAGLAAAHALLRVEPDLHIEVFERGSYTPMGAGVLLNVNGQQALEALDPEVLYHALERSVVLTKTCYYDAHTGELTDQHMTNNRDMLERWGKAPRLIGWHELRQTLLEALPDGVVHFVQPVLSHLQTDDGVEIDLLDEPAPVKAQLLIGADGWFSGTRYQLLHDGIPEFQGTIFWRARIPWRKGLPKDYTQWFVEGDRRTTRFACIIPVSGEEVVWLAGAPVAALRAAGLDVESQAPRGSSMQSNSSFQADTKERCLAVFSDFCRMFSDVVDLTDGAAVTEHPLHQRSPDSIQRFGHGRVTLVGDAAHTSPPNGQGANLAMEDALALGHAVRQHGLTPAALRAYEEAQIPRVKDVLLHGTDLATQEDRERVIYSHKFTPLRPNITSPTS